MVMVLNETSCNAIDVSGVALQVTTCVPSLVRLVTLTGLNMPGRVAPSCNSVSGGLVK